MCNPRRVMIHLSRAIEEAWRTTVEQAATASLFDDPQHPYTRALLRSVPRLDKRVDRLEAVPGAVPPATDWPAACRFHPRCPHAWDRCRSEMPTLLDIGTQREVRCWLAVDPDRGLK